MPSSSNNNYKSVSDNQNVGEIRSLTTNERCRPVPSFRLTTTRTISFVNTPFSGDGKTCSLSRIRKKRDDREKFKRINVNGILKELEKAISIQIQQQ
ncbi:hypothetical protein ABK040_004504 [Willaertia magna]